MATDQLKTRLRNALRGDTYSDELFGLIKGSTGKTFYVDSNLGNASWAGLSSNRATSTLALALAQTTASKDDTIVLMPGHVESIGDAQIDINKAGVNVVGLGHGSSRPRFDFDHANASINIGASSVTVRNITLRPSAAAVLIAIDVETLFTDVLIEDVEILPGEEGDGTDEFTIGIGIKVGCTRTTVRRFKERQHASSGGTIAGIQLTGASDDVLIEDCDIYILGAGVLAPINGITTLSTNFRARRNILMTDAEPCIEMLTGTTGILENNYCFTNLATIDASIVADGCAMFENYYVEVAPEAGALIGTPSVDD